MRKARNERTMKFASAEMHPSHFRRCNARNKNSQAQSGCKVRCNMQVGLNAAKCIRKACTPGTHLLRGLVFQTPRCVQRVSIQCSAGTEHGTAKLPNLASILPGCVPSVLSAALEEYPDLAEVDEEYALMWIRSAGSVLKLREQDVQVRGAAGGRRGFRLCGLRGFCGKGQAAEAEAVAGGGRASRVLCRQACSIDMGLRFD